MSKCAWSPKLSEKRGAKKAQEIILRFNSHTLLCCAAIVTLTMYTVFRYGRESIYFLYLQRFKEEFVIGYIKKSIKGNYDLLKDLNLKLD